MKKVFYSFLVLLFICIGNGSLNAQNRDKSKKYFDKAIEKFNQSNPSGALNLLAQAIEADSNYIDPYLALAEYYYNAPQKSQQQESFAYYQKVISLNKDYDPLSHYRLGEFYIQSYDTIKAKAEYEYYLSKLTLPKDSTAVNQAQKALAQVAFVTWALQNPVAFDPVDMGDNINISNHNYFPSLSADEQTLIFTSRIKEYDTEKEQLYISKKQGSLWKKAQPMPYPFNQNYNIGAFCLSPDGTEAYYTVCNREGGFGSCDIYYSKRKGNTWSEPKNLGSNVNSSAWDSQPSIASDNRTLFFASTRKGGYGRSDIYYSYKKDDGTWTKAKNLGSVINTQGDEMFPFIHPSNTTLYFSSDGHVGMGGRDIFFSRITEGKFSTPTNLGYPINTAEDQTSFVVTPQADKALISSTTDITNQDWKDRIYIFDLYKQAQPNPITYMKGKVFDKKTSQAIEAKFEVRDLATKRLIASTLSDSQTGEYLVVLPLGASYALEAQKDGYLFYSEHFSLQNDPLLTTFAKDIALTPIIAGQSVVLHNIFFKTNSSELLPTSIAELNTLVEFLSKNKTVRIEIAGHTDNTGEAQYNLTLSQKRAQSVGDYLIANGIEAQRLLFKGYGDTKPLAPNTTEEGKAQNRRTEFSILTK